MGIKRLTYLDIPVADRAAQANRVRAQIKQVLGNPLASEEQRAASRKHSRLLAHWEQGTLPTKPSNTSQYSAIVARLDAEAQASRTPRNHEVEVSEDVTIKES